MTLKKILEMLESIEGQLDDAYYNLPEYDANSDGKSYIDGARCDIYYLKDMHIPILFFFSLQTKFFQISLFLNFLEF